MIWYIETAERFRAERIAIEQLSGDADWLRPLEWRIDTSARMNFDADILVGDQIFPVSLRYPNHFPHSPPLVVPRGNVPQRWSSHQWGAGGELCLEIGADNWRPDITGAQMLESAYRLLAMEVGRVNARDIPSRHESTLGQDLRGTAFRFIATSTLWTFLQGCDQLVLRGRVNATFHDECIVYHISQIDLDNGDTWKDPSAPKPLTAESWNPDCVILRQAPGEAMPDIAAADAFWAELTEYGIASTSSSLLVLVLREEKILVYRLSTTTVSNVAVIGAQSNGHRLPADHAALADRKVAVIGCGSMGSKIASSLARSGVGSFLLVDDDLLLPGNFVRHDLDWRDIATHKADAVARRIQLVNPLARTEIRRHRLGGHEASGSLETLIESVSETDLIIDATSTPEAFNYLCAAVAHRSKPMIWAEVHGGGIGGLIARHRPGIEPEPAMMRLAIENWCGEKGIAVERAERAYEDHDANIPWIADDADVSVIAGHASRFAIDLLISRNPSMFPHSVYFIGLAEGWFYSEPFHTEPVTLAALQQPASATALDAEEANAERTLVLNILERSFRETDPS